MFKLFDNEARNNSLHKAPIATNAFSALELYEFDLNGFLIIRNFLSATQVEQANKLIDQYQDNRYLIEFPLLTINEFFLDLMSNQRLLAISQELLGPWFRFEEAYGVQSDQNSKAEDWGINLHGGHFANQGAFSYQWVGDRPQCGVIVFGINLKQVNEGDGGLVVVPGSHNQNIPITGKELDHDLLKGKFEEWPWLKNPKLNPGDLILFTEALIHGTSTWKPKERGRRILYYRYCPGYMTWRRYDQIEKEYLTLARNDLERQLLRPPYVGEYDTAEQPRWKNHYRSPTLSKDTTAEFTLDGQKIRPKLFSR